LNFTRSHTMLKHSVTTIAPSESTGLPDLPPGPPESLPSARALASIMGERSTSVDGLADGPAGYEFIRQLGRGAMGEVFLAHHLRLKRFVALKMIRAGTADSKLRERLVVEAEAIARLQHPNIVQIFEVGEAAGGPFLALEYAEGGSLDKHLAGAPLPPGRAAALIEVLARAVHHAHERGLVHRDLKPANVLLAQGGTPKVTDFGLVHDLASGPGGGVVGTPGYMAPEQAGGTEQITPRTDIYALGAILYECLTGRPPFVEPTAAETLLAVQTRDPVPIRQLRPAVPRDLATICEACLRKDAARRYGNAAALAEDLARFARGEPIAARPVGRAERAWKWARRRPLVATLSSVSAVALAGLLVGGTVYQFLLRDANRLAVRHQVRAEDNYRKALAAVERLLTRVGDDKLVNVPEMEGVRADLLKDALEFYQGFLAAADDPDPAIRWETAQAFGRVARIQQYLGRSEDAAAHFRQAIGRMTALATEFPERIEFRDGLAEAVQRFGLLLVRWPADEQAGDQFDRARRIWLTLSAAAPETPRYRAQAATCDHLEGFWHLEAGRLREAEAAYVRALAVRRAVAESDPTADARRNLATTLHNLARLFSTTNRSAAAFEHEAEAVGLFEAAARDRPDDVDDLGMLSGGLHNLAIFHAGAGRPDDARRCHERALAVRERLARAHPLVPAYQGGLADTCMALAALDLGRGRPADAEPHARRAVALLERDVESRPHDLQAASFLFAAQSNLALLYQSTKRPAEAKTVYAEALAIADRLTAAEPDNLHYWTDLAALCHNRGNLEREDGGPRNALPWYARAIQAADTALAKDDRLIEARTWRMFVHGSRAQAYEELSDFAAAVRDWDQMIDVAPPANRTTYRLLRTTALARAGDYDRLEAEAAALSVDTKDAAALQHLAEACAAAATRARSDDQLPARAATLSTRAKSLLQQAIANADLKRRGEILLAMISNPDLKALNRQPERGDLSPAAAPR
jgi:tetratricopeptide (TPR) repeat protein/tRNA A-37 threonylcarbamoyl transferase component Bud32